MTPRPEMVSAPSTLSPGASAIYIVASSTEPVAAQSQLGTDSDPQGANDLVIRWNQPRTDFTQVHVFVSVNDSAFQYLGRTTDGTFDQIVWDSGNATIPADSAFTTGPLSGNTYRFPYIPFVGSSQLGAFTVPMSVEYTIE